MSTHPMSIRLVDLDDALRIRDLTDPNAGPHALQLVVDELVSALAAEWQCDVRRVTGRRVVTLADNYDRLGYQRDSVTLDSRYTRYVDPDRVLRSHSTAMIPPALRTLADGDRAGEAPADVLLACPGICYRRDSVDWQHTGTPHQMDLWRVTTGRSGTEQDLEAMIALVVATALPGCEWRTVAAEHPYTERGRQVDVLVDGRWVEIAECGLIAAPVLSGAGLDPARWKGLAMGVGLDRLLMLRTGIPDIRLLRSPDERVSRQMLALEPYRPVSHMPPVRRDLSLVVGPETDLSAEAVGDRVREALGGDADAVETVEVVAATPYDALPIRARQRLGLRPGQRNALVRLVLRSLDRSLTDLDANWMRDRVYSALHEGVHQEWAASSSKAGTAPAARQE